MRKQPSQGVNVVLAIVEDVALLLLAERRALQDTIPHFLLAGDIDLVFEEVAQRTTDRIEAFPTFAAHDRAVVNAVPKLNIGVERACRLGPT